MYWKGIMMILLLFDVTWSATSEVDYAFTPLSLKLDVMFNIAYTDLDREDTQTLATSIEAELGQALNKSVPTFSSVKTVFIEPSGELESLMDVIKVNLDIVTESSLEHNKNLQVWITKTLETEVKDGQIGGYKTAPGDRPYEIQRMTLDKGQPKVYALTEGSLSIQTPFLMKYTDVNDQETKALMKSVEWQLNAKLRLLPTFMFAQVPFLRKADRGVEADVIFATFTVEKTFNATATKDLIAKGLQDIVSNSKAGTDDVLFTAFRIQTPQIGVLPQAKNYAFGLITFRLTREMTFEYTNQNSLDSRELSSRVEREVKEYGEELPGYTSTTSLEVKQSTDGKMLPMVQVIYWFTGIGSGASFRVRSVFNDLSRMTVSDGYLGGYEVDLGSLYLPAQVTVTWSPPLAWDYAFVACTVQLIKDFHLDFTYTYNSEAQALKDMLEKEVSSILASSYYLVQAAFLREEDGLTAAELNIASLEHFDVFNARAIEAKIQELVNSTSTLGVAFLNRKHPYPLKLGAASLDAPDEWEYAFTLASISLQEPFTKEFHIPDSPLFQLMRKDVAKELKAILGRTSEFIQTDVVKARDQHGNVVLDIHIISLLTKKNFDESKLHAELLEQLEPVINRGRIADYDLDQRSDPIVQLHSTSLGAPPSLDAVIGEATRRTGKESSYPSKVTALGQKQTTALDRPDNFGYHVTAATLYGASFARRAVKDAPSPSNHMPVIIAVACCVGFVVLTAAVVKVVIKRNEVRNERMNPHRNQSNKGNIASGLEL